jgi:hypothetical protein
MHRCGIYANYNKLKKPIKIKDKYKILKEVQKIQEISWIYK